mgnify:FL=1
MDQLSNLFVNGCSFLTHRHTHEADINFNVGEMVKDQANINNFINYARGGRGNDRIFLTTMTYFEKFPHMKKDTFVLIGWSSALRLDYPTKDDFKRMPDLDQCWSTIKMAESISQFDNLPAKKQPINHVDWEVQRYFQNVLGLQNYLKVNNIRYVMYNALPQPEIRKNDHHTLYRSIDKKHFFDADSSQYYYCQVNDRFISTTDHHPSEKGIEEWAGMVWQHIKENKLYEI